MRVVKVYIAAPYSIGNVGVNVHRAIEAAECLLNLGFAPYCPHLCHFWHVQYPQAWETWLELDLEFLACCDAVLRLYGDSLGADIEVSYAQQDKIPVFNKVDDLVSYFRKEIEECQPRFQNTSPTPS